MDQINCLARATSVVPHFAQCYSIIIFPICIGLFVRKIGRWIRFGMTSSQLRPWKYNFKLKASNIQTIWRISSSNIPANIRNFIVDSASPILVNALVQVFVGLLSSTKLAHEVQIEFDKLMTSQTLNLPDIQYLSVLPAIVSEALRLSLILSPPSLYYRVDRDVWYENWFLPKGSLLVFDREDIFLENKKLADTQVRYACFIADDQFRPDRYWEISPTVGEVDEIAFKYGLEQKYLVNLILLNSVATTLRKFTIARGASDGKLKFVRYAVKRK
jgi:hypothetical protein